MGVRYTQNGRDEVARVTREIILCGGAVELAAAPDAVGRRARPIT